MTAEQYLKVGKTHHLVPPIVFGSVALLMLTLASIYGQATASLAIVYVIGGLLTWTLLEYVLHRFPFHYLTDKEPWKLLTSGFHLLHHEIPNAPDYVVAPMIMAGPIFTVLLGLLWLISGSLEIMAFWGSGIAVGYLAYEWIHYSTHQRPARTALGRYLKQYHMLHHFKDSHNYFGVSTPLWDIVFGTKPSYDPARDTEILPIRSREKVAAS